jgi:hypothetical protein
MEDEHERRKGIPWWTTRTGLAKLSGWRRNTTTIAARRRCEGNVKMSEMRFFN